MFISWPLIWVCFVVGFTIGGGGFALGWMAATDRADDRRAAERAADRPPAAAPLSLLVERHDPADPWRLGRPAPRHAAPEMPPLYAWRPTAPLEAAPDPFSGPPEPDTMTLTPRGWLAGLMRVTGIRPAGVLEGQDHDRGGGTLEVDLELAGHRTELEIAAMIDAAEATIGRLTSHPQEGAP